VVVSVNFGKAVKPVVMSTKKSTKVSLFVPPATIVTSIAPPRSDAEAEVGAGWQGAGGKLKPTTQGNTNDEVLSGVTDYAHLSGDGVCRDGNLPAWCP